jgi:hypothetical protein
MAESEKPTEPGFQVVTVPEQAMQIIGEYIKKLEKDNPAVGSGSGVTGTGCRLTAHSDMHCSDTDTVAR